MKTLGIGFMFGSSLFLCAEICAAGGPSITGRVLNDDASPIQGAAVALVSSGASVSTDKFGLFSLAVSSVRRTNSVAGIADGFSFRNGILSVNVLGSCRPLEISIGRVDGKSIVAARNANPEPGIHAIDLAQSFRKMAAGVYLVTLRLGNRMFTEPVLYSVNDHLSLTMTGAHDAMPAFSAKTLGEAPDTLKITDAGYQTRLVPIGSADSTVGDIVLDTLNAPAYKQTIVATTTAADYSTGNTGILKLEDNSVVQNCLAVGSDTYIRTYHGAVYILERFGKDNVIRVTGRNISPATVDYQVNIGHSVNIQDIAFASDKKAYITQLQSQNIVIFDPSTGSKTGSIDLSRYDTYAGAANAEPYPYMSSAIAYGGYLYVACQRLAHSGVNLIPGDTSCIAVISTFTDSIACTIKLVKKNPYSMGVSDGKLFVSCPGAWGNSTDGGVECVDLFSNKDLGVVAEEADFGGDVSTIQMTGPSKGYVAVGKNSPDFTTFWTDVVSFNPQARSVGQTVQNIDNAFGGLAFDGQFLYVGDRSLTKPGIVVINPADDTKKAGPFSMGLPPNALAFLKSN